MPTLDYANPCAVLPSLREAYYKMLGGQRVVSIEFTTAGGTKRTTEFHRVDINLLREEVRRLEAMCAATQGGSKRRVILAG